MTPELQDKLKDLLPIEPEENFPYVPKVFRECVSDKKLWPIFMLRGLDGEELAAREDQISYTTYGPAGEPQFHFTSGAFRMETLKKGIKGWKNYRTAEGKEIPFSADNVKCLPIALQKELQNAIQERSLLTSEELQGLEL